MSHRDSVLVPDPRLCLDRRGRVSAVTLGSGRRGSDRLGSAARESAVCSRRSPADKINKTVSWGKSEILHVEYTGSVSVQYGTGISEKLENVYCVPKLGLNPLSMNRMPYMTILFNNNTAQVYHNKTRKSVATDYKNNGP